MLSLPGVRGHSSCCCRHPSEIKGDTGKRGSCCHIDAINRNMHKHTFIHVHKHTNLCHLLPQATHTANRHLCYISVTMCRGGSRAIIGVRQEIPLCGCRLMNTQGATGGEHRCLLRLKVCKFKGELQKKKTK